MVEPNSTSYLSAGLSCEDVVLLTQKQHTITKQTVKSPAAKSGLKIATSSRLGSSFRAGTQPDSVRENFSAHWQLAGSGPERDLRQTRFSSGPEQSESVWQVSPKFRASEDFGQKTAKNVADTKQKVVQRLLRIFFDS